MTQIGKLYKSKFLLTKAQNILNNVKGLDIPKNDLKKAYNKVKSIYRRIKKIEPEIYNIIHKDNNKKIIK